MPAAKSRKKITNTTVRLEPAELEQIKRAAAIDKRSINAFFLHAAMQRVNELLREQPSRNGK